MKSKKRKIKNDTYFIKEALKEALKAEGKDEVPIGAVIELNGRIISRGHNKSISSNDPTAHAEIEAIRKAAKKLKTYRLNVCKLYVTIEPCPMCAGALVWARVAEIIFGAHDVKAGACGSVLNVAKNKKLNHRIKVTGGVLAGECRGLIQRFFSQRRDNKLGSS